MKLEFRSLPPGEMERDPTQRDQFNNDEVELVEALVRESIQNSLDASTGGAVEVRFRFSVMEGKSATRAYEFLDTNELDKHLTLCGLSPVSDTRSVSILVIEDFGTTGLKGNWNSWDQGPFCDFWRRMGKSHKGGKSLGRWGLGKLVFSSSSSARTLVGLTIRDNDTSPLLMGQVVLKHHELADGTRIDSHGFYCDLDDGGMQLPSRDASRIAAFNDLFGLSRVKEPGLSVVIPFLRSDVDSNSALRAVVTNYFVPILFGRLVVQVDGARISAKNYGEVALSVANNDERLTATINFIDEINRIYKIAATPPLELPAGWARSQGDLIPDVDAVRTLFQGGQVCAFRAPLKLLRKDGTPVASHVDVYLKKADVDVDAMFVRRSIVLSAEKRYFRGKKTACAILAEDDGVAEFLADAENPAHTGCSASAERVVARWRAPRERLKEIRDLAQRLYSLLSVDVETIDKDALFDFFSVPSEDGARGGGAGGEKVDRPFMPKVSPTPSHYKVHSTDRGFAVVGDASAPPGLVVQVSVAYDLVRGDPFAKHHPSDFDLRVGSILVESDSADFTPKTAFTGIITSKGGAFRVEFSGFDMNRDIAVLAEVKS